MYWAVPKYPHRLLPIHFEILHSFMLSLFGFLYHVVSEYSGMLHPHFFRQSLSWPYHPNQTIGLKIFSLESLEYGIFNFDLVLCYETVFGFFDIPLPEIFQFSPTCSRRMHQFQPIKRRGNTNDVTHSFQFLIAWVWNQLLVEIFNASLLQLLCRFCILNIPSLQITAVNMFPTSNMFQCITADESLRSTYYRCSYMSSALFMLTYICIFSHFKVSKWINI